MTVARITNRQPRTRLGGCDNSQLAPRLMATHWGVDLTSVPSRGAADSPVTLVMFTDFGNPACANAGVILQGLIDMYPKGLRVVFKHTLPADRPDRLLAHEAVRAAGEQGKFWQMHDLRLANHGRQRMADVLEMARQLELDVARFRAALESGAAGVAI